MTDSSSGDSVRGTVTVQTSPERAWEAFTAGFAGWWPREYTWAGGVLEDIGIEPREGGLCSERGPHGFRCDWGRVLAWDPPRRLVLAWQIGPTRAPVPDPAKASEVEVRFVPAGPETTRVELEHRHFARHGDDADAYRAGMGSPQGWTWILERYAARAASG